MYQPAETRTTALSGRGAWKTRIQGAGLPLWAGIAVAAAIGVLAGAPTALAGDSGEAVASWPQFLAIAALVLLLMLLIVKRTLSAVEQS